MTIIEIISILLIHWFADFVLQTHWQAFNKSKNNEALTMHVLSYSAIWFVISHYMILIGFNPIIILFAPITFIFHWITDYYTSRINSKLWAKGNVHGFFVSVGFDQVLHYVQLILCYKYLTYGS